MNRFTDIDLENKKLLPINGYWTDKLVPLEKALEHILPQIDQLHRSIEAAKEYCHYPSEHGLSVDESAAVYLYTMEGGENSFYRVLNQVLRAENRRVVTPWFPYLKLIDTALNKLPTVKKTVWRGVSGHVGKSFKKGQELTWWNLSSCSTAVNVIKGFLGTDSTLFTIEVINGKDISKYTNFPDESEVLLGPGTRLRVESDPLDHSGGLHVIHLVEISTKSDKQSPTPSDKGASGTGQPKSAFDSPPVAQATKQETFSGESAVVITG